MAKLIYGMMQSLDGYISGPEGGPQLPMPGEALQLKGFHQPIQSYTLSAA